MGLLRFVATLGLLLAAAPAGAQGGESSSRVLESAAVRWKELRFAGHKAGISATVDLRLDRVADGLSDGLLLESTTHLPGRTFVARERVDPARAGAREIVDTETGVKHHRKTYTLRERGFELDLLEPASLPEMLLPPEQWTKLSRSFIPYPRALAPGTAITGPAGLLYATATSGLTSQGDSMTIHVLVQTQVERVTVRVEGTDLVDLAFDARSRGGVSAVREQLSALRLVAHSQPVDPASSSAFRIFGLEGDVRILWDPGRGLPVELSGHVKMLGHVEVRLASATLL
ncbi:MAG: hypothetical protein LAO05_03450 [Acidobacteriia bacterium]|nr:hypothetical protein [Terriglobia bacterium]